MSFIVSPILPFPNIYWWSFVAGSTPILFDGYEHFEKMTFRNRYVIAAANGPVTLSIPLVQGREQRKPMNEVLICNKNRWQLQHWRTLVSAYNRSPYFEHYMPELILLFEQPFERLIDFNMASIRWLQKVTGFCNDISFTDSYSKDYPEAVTDLRPGFRANVIPPGIDKFPPYYQVFDTRLGFIPNLSILDLLFSEGRNGAESIVDSR